MYVYIRWNQDVEYYRNSGIGICKLTLDILKINEFHVACACVKELHMSVFTIHEPEIYFYLAGIYLFFKLILVHKSKLRTTDNHF